MINILMIDFHKFVWIKKFDLLLVKKIASCIKINQAVFVAVFRCHEIFSQNSAPLLQVY